MEGINEKLSDMKEWAKAVVFDSKGSILGKLNCEPTEDEIQLINKKIAQGI